MSSKGKSYAETGGGTALVPKLRFPQFRDAGDWKPKQLGHFLSESRLPGSKGDVAKKITVRLWGGGVFAKNEAVQGSANTQYFQRKAGQLIYSKLDFLNQAFGIIPDELDGYESTADLPCFDISGDLNPAFILECVKRKDFYLKVGEAADGSRIAKRIHPETFLASEIPLPSLSEQQKIADCLDSVDALIAAQGRKVEALKAHKKGLILQLFPQEGETQPRLRFPEFERAGEWEEKAVGDFGQVVTGSTPSTANPTLYGGGIPFVSPADISELRYVDETRTTLAAAGFEKTRPIRAGSVLFVCIGSTIGKIAQNVRDCATNQQINAVIPNAKHSDGFVYFALSNASNRIALLAGKQAVPIINKSLFSSVRLLVPSFPEQQRIADCLTSLDELIAAEMRKRDRLKTHKKGLMQQLFPAIQEYES